MKWYNREITFKGQPYHYFLADVIWSAVLVLIIAAKVVDFGGGMGAMAAACTATTMIMARMIYRRVAAARADLPAAARAHVHPGLMRSRAPSAA